METRKGGHKPKTREGHADTASRLFIGGSVDKLTPGREKLESQF